MLDQKIELEHESNTTNIISYLLGFPRVSAWNLAEIEQTQILNVKRLKDEMKVEEVAGKYLMFSNKPLKDYIVKSIKQMLEGESAEMIKTGFTILNNTIKSIPDLAISKESAEFA